MECDENRLLPLTLGNGGSVSGGLTGIRLPGDDGEKTPPLSLCPLLLPMSVLSKTSSPPPPPREKFEDDQLQPFG
jgi:hypothetical protein